MQDFLAMIKECIPIIVGALIAIVPSTIEKVLERKTQREENTSNKKQELYMELISLFGKVLKRTGPEEEYNIDELRNKINLVSITGSTEVVTALNEYLDTWGKEDSLKQSEKYTELLKTLRVDLQVDKKINCEFPSIGLRDINIK